MNKNYTTIVGMEIHVELKTKSKMFCGCKNDPFHAEKPNTYTCPVCLGMPGGLPVPNKKAIEWTIMLGQALGCEISLFSKFDRKNYFYPDLAKGYQISQYDQPLCKNGKLEVGIMNNELRKEEKKIIRIRRVHLEEDTGKLQHATVDGSKVTLVDFNRSGVPLVEIVTEPDIRSGDEAKAFLKKLHQIVRYLDISDANMEQGSMRLEPNISVMNNESGIMNNGIIEEKDLPKYKVEVKNINSFNFVKKAIEFEVPRHISILEKGELPVQETRGWNEAKNETVSQRRKEDADDYRYFPDPDIPPLRFTGDQLKKINDQLPELPDTKLKRFTDTYLVPQNTASVLVDEIELASYFEEAVKKGKEKKLEPKSIANWIVNKKIDYQNVRVDDVLTQIVQATTIVSVPDEEILKAIKSVLDANPKAVADFKSGKETVIMFLFGQAMKALQGKGDKAKIQDMLKQLLQ